MSSMFKRNVHIGLITLIACPAFAQQPPDSVLSDRVGNTAMGDAALLNLINSNGGNTAAGASALTRDTTGAYNSAFGYLALFSNLSGIYNTAVGAEALYFNTSGTLNTAMGAGALNANTTGSYNAALGQNALLKNTTGIANTASGFSALLANTSGSGNTADGDSALVSNTTGTENTASGFQALSRNTTGYWNTASGEGALGYNTTGNYNTASGAITLNNAVTGSNNTAIGYGALYSNETGSSNIALGYQAGSQVMGSSNIDIGSAGSAADNGVIRIGAAGVQGAAYIAGVQNAKVTGSAVFVTASGQLGVLASAERYKTHITPMGSASEPLQQLRPVSFHLKSDPSGPVQYGLIAEEVATVYPELVTRDEQGATQGVRYDELAPLLLNELQRQTRVIRQQQQRSAMLEQRLAAQGRMLRQLSRQQVAIDGGRGVRHSEGRAE